MCDLEQARKNLPIFAVRNKLISEFQKNSSLVLLGETGCGKTTQIPQYILESQSQMRGMIACTQPRRVAAITVAQRVAAEMNCPLGQRVGYSVRFEETTTVGTTKIKYMTDGMLLREAINDPLLSRYAVIILDEVHERTIHTDVLMGIVKEAQKKRAAAKPQSLPARKLDADDNVSCKPLKVILMSATMDVDEFSAYFNKAPVFFLEGRQFGVEIFHAGEAQTDYTLACITTLFQVLKNSESSENEDILIFMTGQEEIDSMVRTINEINKSGATDNCPLLVMPLYAALPPGKQLRVFEKAPAGHRKVIVSTNVAETSITIQGVKYVIDSGMIKGKLYLPSHNLEMLKVHRISKSQAWQRSGRAGREAPGICYRMFTEEEFNAMEQNTIPEILRSNLSAVCLQLIALGVSDVAGFDFMSKPSRETIVAALDELELLEAVVKKGEKPTTSNGHSSEVTKKRKHENGDEEMKNADEVQSSEYELTQLGKKMAQFPLDPKLSRCVLASVDLNCVEDVLKIVSCLSVETIFHENAKKKKEDAQTIKQKFVSADGDHATLLNVYKAYVGNKNKEWCNENNLDYKNLKMASDIRKQLRDICLRMNINLAPNGISDTTSVRRALIHGFFTNTAEFFKENEFKTISGRQTVQIHPSSVLFNSKPACVVFNELVKTSKTYMRDVSVINNEWLLSMNPNYFKSKLKHSNGFLSNLETNGVR